MRQAVIALLSKYGKLLALGLAGVSAIMGLLWWQPALAQTTGWSSPHLIFEGRGSVTAPTLVADSFGQVHAFWLFQPEAEAGTEQQMMVYYTRLDRLTWPVNDIFAGASRFTVLKAVMTRAGLALLWGGNGFAWSSSSPGPTAKDWTGPQILQAVYPESALTVAPDGALWMISSATGTNEIYVQRLDPDTQIWDAPLLVGDPVNTNAAPDATRLAIGADGSLHAVWAEYQLPNGWPPLGLYYTQSTDGGKTWSSRLKIAGQNYNQPNVVTGPDKQVYLTWTGTAGIGQKFFQESLDGGQNWESPVIVMKDLGGGSEGAPNLAVDSAGNLHMVFSHNGCVWYAGRENNTWSVPECISHGAAANAQIEFPTMTLGLGNELHVLFWTDRRQLWYTTMTLPLAGIPPQATSTPFVPTATSVLPTLVPTPVATYLPDYGPAVRVEQATQPGVWALVAGVAPVLVLVLAVAVFRRTRRR